MIKVLKLAAPGGLDCLSVIGAPDPGAPKRGEIRVRILASSLNFHDLGVVNGRMSRRLWAPVRSNCSCGPTIWRATATPQFSRPKAFFPAVGGGAAGWPGGGTTVGCC